MLKRYSVKRVVGEIRRIAVTFDQIRQRMFKSSKIISEFIKTKNLILKNSALKKINLKPMIKASNFTQGFEQLHNFCKKIATKMFVQALEVPVKTIFNCLESIFSKAVSNPFQLIKSLDIEKRLSRPNVSNRVKAKILVSLNKF